MTHKYFHIFLVPVFFLSTIITAMLLFNEESRLIHAQDIVNPIQVFKETSHQLTFDILAEAHCTNSGIASDLSTSTTQSSAQYDEWWVYAYHRLENNQCDIYIAPDFRGERDPAYNRPVNYERSLTSHPAADFGAQLRWDGSTVVFVSNRDGQFEIYTIQEDGGGLQRLTNDDAADFAPTWSPDGEKIVFVSNRSGVPQIYQMESDGSNIVQLSQDNAPHIYPDWSPDGTRLTWLEVLIDPVENIETRKVQLYHFDNALVGDLTPPLSLVTQPRWSPNSSLIAFSFDDDKNFLNEMATVDPATSKVIVYKVAGTEPFREYTVSSWVPDEEQRILVKEVQYNIRNNKIFSISRAQLDINVDLVDANNVVLRTALEVTIPYEATGTNISPSDFLVPISQVDQLPEFVYAPDALLNWSGQDRGPLGIESYDVEYRPTNGLDWFSLVENTGALDASLAPLPSGHYQFRSRAIDYAGNQGEFTTDPAGDASTTLYRSILSGRLTDNRGVSLGTRPITVDSISDADVLNRTTTTAAGNYKLYVTDDVPIAVHSDVRIPVGPALMRQIYELPNENLIQDSHFESSQSAWVMQNSQPITEKSQVYAGAQSVQLRGVCDGLCAKNIITFTANPGYADSIQFSNVEVLLTAKNDIDLFYEGTHQRWTAAQGWSISRAVIESQLNNPPLYDASGNLHIFGDYDHQYQLKDESVWQEAIPFDACGDQCVIKSGVDGKLHMISAFDCDDFEYRCTLGYSSFSINGGWTRRSVIPASDVNGSGIEFDFSVLNDGTIHAVWFPWLPLFPTDEFGNDDYTDTSEYSENTPSVIYHQHSMQNGKWSQPTEVFHHTQVASNLRVLDELGKPRLIAWHETEEQNFTTGPTADWANALRLRREFYSSIADGQSHFHRLRVGEKFNGTADTTVFNYRFGTSTTGWDDAQTFDMGNVMRAKFSELYSYSTNLSPAGTLYAVSATDDTEYTIWHQPRAEAASVSYITQAVTIPEEMRNPTLSFMHRVNNMNADPESRFNVTISADISTTIGVTESTLLSVDTNTSWQLGWADLSPWAGETVTVTFALHQAANENIVTASLDEVMIGPWTTPLVDSLSQYRLDVGEAATVTITGANFLETTAIKLGNQLIANMQVVNDETIEIVLPTTISPGIYPVTLVSSTGLAYTTQTSLQVGKQLYLPTILR